MLDILIDSILDTFKLIPYLFITFIILELIEHKLSKKNEIILRKNKKIGPFLGGILGGIPQCGFSVIASRLFTSRVITIGTLVSIYLATSDEMLPIMISNKVNFMEIFLIVLFKVIIGIIIGFIIDFIYKKEDNIKAEEFSHDCRKEHCHCKEKGIIVSSLKHTIKISFFILIANFIIGFIIEKLGHDNISKILLSNNILKYFGSSLIGLIPNCCSSVIITELYLSKLITLGTLLSGLLTGSGLGILILFKENKDIKENILILSIIYIIGVLIGIIVDLII